MYWPNVEWRLETWALAHFKRLGIDHQTVNMDQLHDENLTFNENKSRILAQYPENGDSGPRQINQEAQAFQAQQEAFVQQEVEFEVKERETEALNAENFRMAIDETPMFSAKWWFVFILEINVLILAIAFGLMFINI